MALVRWQPFQEMGDLQRQMNRLFDDMVAPADRRDGVGALFSPAAELEENEDAYHLKLEVPGMEPGDINVDVTAEAVAITGERKSEQKTENKGMTRTEFRYGKFQRVIPLPGRINHQNVSADYKNGVLNLNLPKAEDEKNKVVRVNIGQ
ncbi:Hsp20/alpha crystallin family protein [Romeria aff. gracilis LEGE 07310]|uniref:Hsp20/alpha crystallin family protein n=1 Tax=Vasconcelosia minhoensis LEGE 07310 TaxID=915328 RepID=A0A8J7DAX7_9CYAN|nr:Hsp20/alpha crystallin family protein [Romeria gracilis]MBE9076957.1 Hsp20/alpha crystallin family protein [Romeria aff. gracilis LEGE 07310]